MENAAELVPFMSIPIGDLHVHFAIPHNEKRLIESGKSSQFFASDHHVVREWLLDAETRPVVRHIIECFFKDMKILELKCDDEFTWEMKLKVGDYMAKVHHRYHIHLVPNPVRFFRDLDELRDDEREIMENTQMELPMEEQDSEREKALANVRKQRLNVLVRLSDQRNDCPEISFEGTVIEAKWPDEGTVLRCKIPASIVNMLNDNRMFLKDDDAYIVRLEKIGE